MTPPTPVLAPPNGSTADGWLCVSALRAIVVPAHERHDAGVADERRAHERRGDGVGGARAAGRAGRPVAVPSAVVIAARNVLWAQCSLHVWASVSSSTSVGSRPIAGEVVADDAQLGGVEGQRPRRRRGGRGRRRRGRGPGSPRRPARRRTRVELGCCRAGRPVLDDRVGDEAPQQRVGGRRRPGSSMRRPVAAAVTSTPSWRAAWSTASAAPSVTPGCSVISMPSRRAVPGAGLQQRVGEERAEPLAVPGVELALDEHDVGDAGGAVEGEAERRRTGGDGRRPGIGVAGPHRETVHRSGAGRHCPDPTAPTRPGRDSERKVQSVRWAATDAPRSSP